MKKNYKVVKLEDGMLSYDCEQCGKSFLVDADAKRHQLEHSPHDPYQIDGAPIAIRKVVFDRIMRGVSYAKVSKWLSHLLIVWQGNYEMQKFILGELDKLWFNEAIANGRRGSQRRHK